jgi:hypothetical protein
MPFFSVLNLDPRSIGALIWIQIYRATVEDWEKAATRQTVFFKRLLRIWKKVVNVLPGPGSA